MKRTNCSRIMLAGGGSGSGKTLITCGIMAALKLRGYNLGSYKCGPDFIDPMFHRTVIGAKSGNLDSFFMNSKAMNYNLARTGEETDLVMMEGVMGFYDGIAASGRGSSWEIGNMTQTPVILIFNGRGMGQTMIAQIKGLVEYEPIHFIQGIILNQVSEKMYCLLKDKIEEETKIPVIGYVPVQKNLHLESRHLGLKMPSEIQSIQEQLFDFGRELEKTVQLDLLIQIAQNAEPISWEEPYFGRLKKSLRLAIAKDEAFCFLYEENLVFLEKIGVEIQYFSPLHDEKLPEGTQALLLPGGYPELYATELESNHKMRADIKEQIQKGMPFLAECGGYLYLGEKLVDLNGHKNDMVGIFPFTGKKQERLGHFGYIEVEAQWLIEKKIENQKAHAHEFHYYETEWNRDAEGGDYFKIQKADHSNSWSGGNRFQRGMAGFPHFSYYSNMELFYAIFDFMTEE